VRRRHHHVLALIAALGVLLHAGMAAAQVFCAMTGALATACCCTGDDRPDAGPAFERADDACCRDALPAPTTDRQQHTPLPEPALAAAWAQVVPPEPASIADPAARAAGATPTPLRSLQSIVLLR